MILRWFLIIGSPVETWALYDSEKHNNPLNWDTPLIGFIERKKDESWDCFCKNSSVGNEKTKKGAMSRVLKGVVG